MSASVLTPKGEIPIPDSDLVSPEDAARLTKETGSASFQEYKTGNKEEQIVYSPDEDRRLFQIIGQNGEIQDAARLLEQQNANPLSKYPNAHWDLSQPGNSQWVAINAASDTVAPAGPRAGSDEAPNVDIFASVRGTPSLTEVYDLLKKVATKVGVSL